MTPEIAKKPKRTLVAINCEHLEHKKFDLTYLEGNQRLTLFLFYRGEVFFWFDIRQDFQSRTFLVPDYETDMSDYLTKIVTYEVARRSEYRKVIFIDPVPERLKTAVQFLRDRGVLAEAYDFQARAMDPNKVVERVTYKSGKPTRVEPIMPNVDPVTGKRRRRRKVKLPTSRANMEMVLRALLKNIVPGETYKKTQISPIIHRETEHNVKDLFPYKNLTGLYRYLVANEIIEEIDKKTFRVLTNEYELGADEEMRPTTGARRGRKPKSETTPK